MALTASGSRIDCEIDLGAFFEASVNTTISGKSRKSPKNSSATVIRVARTQRGSPMAMGPLCEIPLFTLSLAIHFTRISPGSTIEAG